MSIPRPKPSKETLLLEEILDTVKQNRSAIEGNQSAIASLCKVVEATQSDIMELITDVSEIREVLNRLDKRMKLLESRNSKED